MKFCSTFLVLFALSFGVTFLLLQRGELRRSPSENVRIEVSSGETVQEISKTLSDAGVIRSPFLFRAYLTWKGMDRALKSGVFLVPLRADYASIAAILIEGNGKEMAVTIPEGFTVAQIDALLTEKGVLQSGDLLACARECDFSTFSFLPSRGATDTSPGTRLEGYLFPDTYFIDVSDFRAKFFLERLLGIFRERVIEDLAQDFMVSERPLHDVVVMASLIERETRAEDERPIVSGILWKRFDSGRALDVDATVRYVLGKIIAPLTKDDLEVDSPYNTRKYPGLPPGPIANPGIESIRAALHPEDSSYWYYLHGENGDIHYAETNDEHNENKARYL